MMISNGIDVTLKAIRLIEYLEKGGFAIDDDGFMRIIEHRANRTPTEIEFEAIEWLKNNYHFNYKKSI
jgi:hypothetical protein